MTATLPTPLQARFARDAADHRTVAPALRFTVLLALIALVSVAIALHERPLQHGSAGAPAAVR